MPTASSAIGGVSSARRKTSTMSTGSGMSASVGYAVRPRIEVSFGVTGMTRNPAPMRIFITSNDGRSCLDDAPTTAIVRALVSIARSWSSLGVWYAIAVTSSPLERRYRARLPHAPAEQHELDRRVDRLFREHAMEIVHARDRRVPCPDEQIARREASECRRTARLHAGQEHRARRRKMISVRLPSSESNRLP